jgi:Glyoxalase-like domain
MARLRDVVVDCRHAASQARFWASVLDGYSIAPYDDAELERLRRRGIESPEDDPTVLIEGSSRPRLWFQTVPEAKVAKNRVHLDLSCDDVDDEVERLKALGASVAADQPNDSLINLYDPEGNEFCLLR